MIGQRRRRARVRHLCASMRWACLVLAVLGAPERTCTRRQVKVGTCDAFNSPPSRFGARPLFLVLRFESAVAKDAAKLRRWWGGVSMEADQQESAAAAAEEKDEKRLHLHLHTMTGKNLSVSSLEPGAGVAQFIKICAN